MTADTAGGERVVLLCTVRGCALPLQRVEGGLVCPRSHSFDRARSGYVNLLQPQDRRSRHPGDSKEAVLARRRFLDGGYPEPLVSRLADLAAEAPAGPLLDAGCGEGHHLEAFRRRRGGEAHGLDISTPAIELAARTFRACSFVVANADRFIPYADGSFALITSITARMNAPEFRRLLRPGGMLVIAVAGPDDLIELREAILGEGTLVDRTEPAIRALEGRFTLLRQESLRTVATLDRQAIADVMSSSYRAMRSRERERLAALPAMSVTLSRQVQVWA